MNITLNLNDLNFSSSQAQVEAYRRAIEIRELHQPLNSNSEAARFEKFVWRTPTPQGVELEEVAIDNELQTLSYSVFIEELTAA